MSARRLLPFLAFLTACAPSKKLPSKNVVVDLEPIDVKASSKAAEVYQEVPERKWALVHTDLKIRFDIPQRQLIGTAQIKLHPVAYPQDSLVLDAQSMDLRKVTVSGRDGSYTPAFVADSARLKIAFRTPQQPTDTSVLTIDYLAKPYAQSAGGFAAIRDDRGLYFVNAEGKISGKPLQIWTQGETESNSHWFPTIDKPNARSTFRFEITVPDSLTVLSNGVKTLEALKSATREKTVVWEMKQSMPPYLAMMAIGNYVQVKDSSALGIPVDYYVEPQYAPAAKAIFRNTPRMIQFFSAETGIKFPWPKYSQVVARDYVSGAMENTSASLFGEFVNGTVRQVADQSSEGVVAHELFHQWFGDYATAKSWSNLTVNESFATVGEMLWDQYQYGADKAAELRQRYLERYLNGAKRKDPALVRHYYASEGEMFDHVSYQKGGLILWSIREQVGPELFRKAMKRYLETNANSPADAQDWRKALEAVTGNDWNPFFNQWYNRGGHPVVRFRFRNESGGTWLLANQTQPALYTLPIQVAVMEESGLLQRLPWTLKAAEDSLWIAHTGPRPVIIPDAAHIVVGEVKVTKPEAEWIRQFIVAEDFRSKTEALTHIQDKTFSQPLYDAVLQTLRSNRNVLRPVVIADLAARDGQWRTAELRSWLRQAATNTTEAVAVRNAALAVYSRWDSGTGNLPMYQSLLTDRSYFVAGTALTAIQKADSVQAIVAARQVLDQGDARSALLSTAAEGVAATGFPEDLARIAASAQGKWGRERAWLLEAAQFHWQADTTAGSAALRLLTQWYQEEEAGFVKNQQLNTWNNLVVRAQEQVDNPEWNAKKGALTNALRALQNAEKDLPIAARIEKMIRRLNGTSAADTED
ncbi:MAG: M1 family peptidase [Sphingobacteriales bacterium]|nr:MAG: M1 family peptidase [Sphingobacteriales bacterium]